jgi:hypothetical protein
MKTNPLIELTVSQLQQAIAIKQEIEALEKQLAEVLGNARVADAPTAPARKRTMSATARAKIAAAQKARWAERKGLAAPKPSVKAAKTAAIKPRKTSRRAARAKTVADDVPF